MKKTLCLFVAISLIVINNLNGQNYSLKGIVLDSYTNEALFYANVGLLKAEDSTSVSGVSTDEQGKFKIANVKAGNYIFQASYIGYDVYRLPLSITGNNTEIQLDTIRLQPTPATLEGVTIYDKKPVYMVDGEKTLYNVSEDPSIQTGTASDALQNAPGVEVDIEGNITLRGVSSVEIWINDKPSRLDAENLKTYIQQLPANSLERIEVITNPSARYSSEGTGGIINIITKSNIKKNSFISFGLNGSSRPMASPWFSYMFSNEKFSINLYAHGYYYTYNMKSNGYNIAFNENMDTSSYRNYTNETKNNSISTGLYANGSYTFDTMNLISFWGGAYGSPFNKNYSSGEYQYREFLSEAGIYDYSEESNSSSFYIGGYIGAWYQHKFNNKGHTIAADIGGSYWKYDQNSFYSRLYHNYPSKDVNKKTPADNTNYSVDAEIDYNLPYCKTGEISIGASGSYSSGIENWRNDTLLANSSDTYILDSMRFKNLHAKATDLEGYLTIQQKFGNFTIKGGVRVQFRDFNYEIINQPQHHGNKTYAGLFPSLHLSYSTKSMHNFTLSYTRRVNYPQITQLNTFIVYGEDNYSTGNEYLLPTYTNSVEAGWTKYFTKFGSVGLSAYFKNSKDEINNLTDVIYNDFFGRYVTFYMPVNSGKSYRYGADANIMYKLKSFMNIRLNASIYQLHSETVFRENEKTITDNLTYSFQLNFWAKLWKFLEVNLSGNYRSKTETLFLIEQPVYSINCGLRSDFWKRKISVYLNVQDIFNWNKQRNDTTNPYYIAYSSTKVNSRFISAGITFRFGKIELEHQARTGGHME